MKNKIKEALKQKNKTLGLGDEVFERVAASVETFITDESMIDAFVSSESTLNLLKSYQSVNDKLRTIAKENEDFKKQSEKQQGENKPEEASEPVKTQPSPEDLASALEALLEKKLNPLAEKLAAFEATKAKEDAVSALNKFVGEWDYAKGYPKESEQSQRIAMKIYKAGGEKMTGEELIAAFREEFDPAVQSKGVTDFSKPFKSDDSGESMPDFSNELAILRAEGVELPD